MARNKLEDLNNHLFAQMERLNDEELTDEQLKQEVVRAKSVSSIASQIISNTRVAMDVVKMKHDMVSGKEEMPKLLTIENED